MDEEILIRPARESDAQSIANVHIQSWKETYPGIVPEAAIASLSLEERKTAWEQHLKGGTPYHRFTFVAEDKELGVVGFASGGAFRTDGPFGEGVAGLESRFDGEFQAIYILKSHQGKGAGKGLAKAVFGELKARGFKSMIVRVLSKNPARGYYERLGGKKIGEGKIKIRELLDETIYGWDQIP